jgi:SAM-dependent methyltransferase
MSNKFFLHVDHPVSVSQSQATHVRGWILSDQPIESVRIGDTLLTLEDRDDVREVHKDYEFVKGFDGYIITYGAEQHIVINVTSGGQQTHIHELENTYHAQDMSELMAQIAQLKRENEELKSILKEVSLLPVPPEYLRFRIGNREDVDHFLGVGRKLYWDLKQQLKIINKDIASFSSVLDFGCGCARVLRYFSKDDHQQLFGADIDHETINWCKNSLCELATFDHINAFEKTHYEDNAFDLIYGISVFTHLPEDMQHFWLNELKRITAPGGYVILSVHGPELLPQDEVVTHQILIDKGFYYRLEKHGTLGLPEFYQTAFHTDDYIAQVWSRYFDVIKITWRGFNFHQNAVLMVNPSDKTGIT